MDDSGTSEEIQSALARKGSESPTRVYDRKELLEVSNCALLDNTRHSRS